MYNCGESVTKWIESYLSYRSQYVSIATKSSEYSAVTHGVLQESVLGPILYVIYTNKLPAIINDDSSGSQVHQDQTKLLTENCIDCGLLPSYADDSTYVVNTSTRFQAQEKIMTNLKKVKTFLDANMLAVRRKLSKSWYDKNERGRVELLPS